MKAQIREIQDAFTEWDRRYREEPELFESEATRLLKGTPKTYGESAAPYFVEILGQVQKGKRHEKRRKDRL